MTLHSDLSIWARRDARTDRLLRSAPSPVHHDESVTLPQQDPWKACAIVSSLGLVVLVGFGSMLRTSVAASPSELAVAIATSVVDESPPLDMVFAKATSKSLARSQ